MKVMFMYSRLISELSPIECDMFETTACMYELVLHYSKCMFTLRKKTTLNEWVFLYFYFLNRLKSIFKHIYKHVQMCIYVAHNMQKIAYNLQTTAYNMQPIVHSMQPIVHIWQCR